MIIIEKLRVVMMRWRECGNRTIEKMNNVTRNSACFRHHDTEDKVRFNAHI